jgi:hypothetical protein
MMPDLNMYAAILKNEKWISKTDFIYRIKTQCDSSEKTHRDILQALYKLSFRQVRKGDKGLVEMQ